MLKLDFPYVKDSKVRNLRLKDLNIFVLDNSLRESTVAQNKGHIKQDKYEILRAVKQTGIDNCILGTFGKLPSVEDQWLQELKDKGMTIEEGLNFFAFSELYDNVHHDSHNPLYTVPIGMSKSKAYGIQNIIIELNIDCPLIGWADLGNAWTDTVHGGSFTMDMLEELLRLRLETFRSYSPHGHVFFNWRDAPYAFQKSICLDRIVHLTRFLATLDPRLRPMGILFEDSEGECFPWEIASLTQIIRSTMDANGWTEGHILCHIHKNFGVAEACVLECLCSGGTGIWCGISEEGAATGSASSIMTLTNLARLGNTFVTEKFNFPNLYKAARLITKLSTGQEPHTKQELYGERALDILWENPDGSLGSDGFHLDKLFNVPRTVRVTSLTTPKMFQMRLAEVFGSSEKAWCLNAACAMQVQLRGDLMQGLKLDYQSTDTLLDLCIRAGGVSFIKRDAAHEYECGNVDIGFQSCATDFEPRPNGNINCFLLAELGKMCSESFFHESFIIESSRSHHSR